MMITLCMTIGFILYIYAEIICKGAVLARFEHKKILLGVIIFTIWQLIMLTAGVAAAVFIEKLHDTEQMQEFTWIVSVFISMSLAVRMIHKAWKNEPVEERREDVLIYKNLVGFSLKAGLRTALIGLVLGFLEISLMTAVIVCAVCVVIVFIAGLYSGYRLGYGYKRMAYAVGAISFAVSGIYLVGCYFIGI